MRIEFRHIRNGIVSYVLGFAVVNAAYSDGYRNPPPTAEGIGKSGVNSVFVDDASAISYNPANLALQTNSSLVVAVTFARTENEYSPAPGLAFDSDGDWNVLPNIYYAQAVGDEGLAFGLGISTPFGQGLSWKKSDFIPAVGVVPPLSPVVPYEASIMLIDINPTVALMLSESLSLGAGFNAYYSKLELKTLLDAAILPFPLPPGVYDSKGDADGWGFGGNLGLTWLPTDRQRLSFTYRSRFDVDYEGDFEVSGVDAGDFEATVKYPNIFGIGYGIQLTDAIQVEALVEWLQWSINDTQSLVAGGISNPQVNNWDDTFTFGVGGDWQLDENWVVRAGYAFIETPIPDSTITPLLPDADRHALSLGFGYEFSAHVVDLAYTFSIYDNRDNTQSGAYDIDSNLVGLTYSYSF